LAITRSLTLLIPFLLWSSAGTFFSLSLPPGAHKVFLSRNLESISYVFQRQPGRLQQDWLLHELNHTFASCSASPDVFCMQHLLPHSLRNVLACHICFNHALRTKSIRPPQHVLCSDVKRLTFFADFLHSSRKAVHANRGSFCPDRPLDNACTRVFTTFASPAHHVNQNVTVEVTNRASLPSSCSENLCKVTHPANAMSASSRTAVSSFEHAKNTLVRRSSICNISVNGLLRCTGVAVGSLDRTCLPNRCMFVFSSSTSAARALVAHRRTSKSVSSKASTHTAMTEASCIAT
jgi:hypothetical protein